MRALTGTLRAYLSTGFDGVRHANTGMPYQFGAMAINIFEEFGPLDGCSRNWVATFNLGGGMMTQLRQRMEELQGRNYSSDTVRMYIQHVAKFAHISIARSPDQLGAEDIRQYQLFLIQEKKLAWSGLLQLFNNFRAN